MEYYYLHISAPGSMIQWFLVEVEEEKIKKLLKNDLRIDRYFEVKVKKKLVNIRNGKLISEVGAEAEDNETANVFTTQLIKVDKFYKDKWSKILIDYIFLIKYKGKI